MNMSKKPTTHSIEINATGDTWTEVGDATEIAGIGSGSSAHSVIVEEIADEHKLLAYIKANGFNPDKEEEFMAVLENLMEQFYWESRGW
jgi:hypothetical protein